MLVLVADDDPVTCEMVAAVVRSGGHTPILARDAMQVMFMATHRRPDVIVLDIQMPAGTGIGALEKLRSSAKTADIPVLIYSGILDEAIMERVRSLGTAGCLAKPADPDTLAAAIERAATRVRPSGQSPR
jgi:CheY-like chemotaxis protein